MHVDINSFFIGCAWIRELITPRAQSAQLGLLEHPKLRINPEKSSFRNKKEREIAKAGKARIKTEITEALVRETHKLVVEQLAKKKSYLER